MRNSTRLMLAMLIAQCIGIAGGSSLSMASTKVAAKVPLRVFIDVTAPEAATAWERLGRQAPRTEFQWLVHPLPLAANQNSHLSAAKVLYARRHARALEWIDARLTRSAGPGPSEAQSWRAISLLPPNAEQLQSLANDVERERRAAIRFGVRATPSLLWCGLPESGVSMKTTTLSKRALRRWEACKRRGQPDCELHHVRRESLDAATALQDLRRIAERGASSLGIGQIGALWRVQIPALLRPQRETTPVTIVWFVDPIRTIGLPQAAALLKAMERHELELVILPLARAGAAIEPAARMLAKLSQNDEPARQALLRNLVAGTSAANTAKLFAKDESTGDQSQTRKHVELLHEIARTASEIGARPSDIFINGRRWLGGPNAAGLDQAVQIAISSRSSAMPYRQRIQRGRWLSQGQRDLGPALGRDPFQHLLWLRRGQSSAASISLLFDPAQWMSRAAYYAVLNLSRERKVGLRLGLVGAAASEALQANNCNVLATWAESVVAGKPRSMKRCKASQSPASSAAMARLASELGADQEPVIYIGRRRYLGPLDENRIRLAFEHAISKP